MKPKTNTTETDNITYRYLAIDVPRTPWKRGWANNPIA